MNCGLGPESVSKTTEITTTISKGIFIGEYKHVRNYVSFKLSPINTVAFNYSLDNTFFEYKPSVFIGGILIENLTSFEYNLNKFIGAPLNTVLYVDVYAHLYGGRITDGYCTVWSGGRLV